MLSLVPIILQCFLEKFHPWVYLLSFALAYSVYEQIKLRKIPHIPLLYFGVVFGIITVVKTKLHWYLPPVYQWLLS